MSRYERYGAISKDNGMVILIAEEGKPSKTIWGNCYNAYMAEMLEVEDFKNFEL